MCDLSGLAPNCVTFLCPGGRCPDGSRRSPAAGKGPLVEPPPPAGGRPGRGRREARNPAGLRVPALSNMASNGAPKSPGHSRRA